MKKNIMLLLLFVALNAVGFYYGVINPVTFTKLQQNPEKTMSKYAPYWNDKTIVKKPFVPKKYDIGDIIGTITIPALEIYEIPIYYGDTDENKNWQLTTPGYEGGWQLFGEYGMTAIGAHNYQMFDTLPSMEVGQQFLVETIDDVYVYTVQSKTIFDHKKNRWIDTVYLGKEPYSTSLLTCYPINAINTEDRYIVYATMQRGTVFIESELTGEGGAKR